MIRGSLMVTRTYEAHPYAPKHQTLGFPPSVQKSHGPFCRNPELPGSTLLESQVNGNKHSRGQPDCQDAERRSKSCPQLTGSSSSERHVNSAVLRACSASYWFLGLTNEHIQSWKRFVPTRSNAQHQILRAGLSHPQEARPQATVGRRKQHSSWIEKFATELRSWQAIACNLLGCSSEHLMPLPGKT